MIDIKVIRNHMQKITVTTTIAAPLQMVWDAWTQPEHIMQWNHAGDDWHCPSSTNDLRVGGKFVSRMEDKKSGEGFDFEGEYTEVIPQEKIVYQLGDAREVVVTFQGAGEYVVVTEVFDAENENSAEMQRQGWQMILDNFKKHVEGLGR